MGSPTIQCVISIKRRARTNRRKSSTHTEDLVCVSEVTANRIVWESAFWSAVVKSCQWNRCMLPLRFCFAAKSTCLGTQCAAKEVCIFDAKNNVPRCVRCDLTCARVPDSEVCGTDAITYVNWCKLRQTSCTFRLLIQVDHFGACEIPQQKVI